MCTHIRFVEFGIIQLLCVLELVVFVSCSHETSCIHHAGLTLDEWIWTVWQIVYQTIVYCRCASSYWGGGGGGCGWGRKKNLSGRSASAHFWECLHTIRTLAWHSRVGRNIENLFIICYVFIRARRHWIRNFSHYRHTSERYFSHQTSVSANRLLNIFHFYPIRK